MTYQEHQSLLMKPTMDALMRVIDAAIGEVACNGSMSGPASTVIRKQIEETFIKEMYEGWVSEDHANGMVKVYVDLFAPGAIELQQGQRVLVIPDHNPIEARP